MGMLLKATSDGSLATATPFCSTSIRLINAPDAAPQIAELGVTENDWRALGTAAAAALQLPVARAAFSHLGDEAALSLLQRVQEQWSAGSSHDLCTAEVLAYQVNNIAQCSVG